MKKHYIALIATGLTFTGSALADSFSFDFSKAGSDPAAEFEAECLDENLDEETEQACDGRAAILEAELLSHLITLEGDDDPESLELFQEVLELDSPALQAIAVQYLARTQSAPSTFLDQVKTFFLGTEPQLGATAANVLAVGSDATDATLGALYNEQRSASDYGPLYAGDDRRLAASCLQDARLDLMSSFTRDEQFSPAERLLMYDRFAFDFSDTAVDYPVTAFVTDAAFEQVTDHFTQMFGHEPHPPAAKSQAELNSLTEQIVALQLDALNGDQDAIQKIQELGDQMAELQEAVTLASQLQLTAFHAENDVFWVDGNTEDTFERLPRAVTVGQDDRLGRVVIRYLNGASLGATSPDGGAPNNPNGEDPTDETPDGGTDSEDDNPPNDDEEPNDDEANPPSSGDSGCSMTAPGRMSSSVLAVLLVATLGLTRRRKR